MKSNFLVHNPLIRYMTESWQELKKVNWPSRIDVINNTVAVIATVIIATAITAVIDYGLSYLVQLLVQRGE